MLAPNHEKAVAIQSLIIDLDEYRKPTQVQINTVTDIPNGEGAIKDGTQVIIATLPHVSKISFTSVKLLIIDEADEILLVSY